jgi:hypothetical protein
VKLLLFAAICVCAAAAAASTSHRAALCRQPSESCPPRQTPRETVTLDPRTVDAATVDDLRHAEKDVVCHVVASTLDLVQLCRDKGFSLITFDAGSAESRGKAERLGLRVVDSAGRKTTNGS